MMKMSNIAIKALRYLLNASTASTVTET